MNFKLKALLFITAILSLTKFSIAENISAESEDNVTAKPLKVEEGATKIGEDKAETKVKTRALSMSHPEDKSVDTNMNIGKIEFFVK